jgi:hypothetical protein
LRLESELSAIVDLVPVWGRDELLVEDLPADLANACRSPSVTVDSGWATNARKRATSAR